MLEHGSDNSLPAKYRIALALSIAFLIHTLLLSGAPSVVPDPPVRHRQQLNLELVAAQSNPQTPASTSTPDNSASAPEKPVLTTSRSQQKTALTDPAKPATLSNPAREPPEFSSRTQMPANQRSENVTRITQSPTEQDPYLIKLAMHLATQLETMRIPAIRELARSSTMEMELQLLGNGALTRVKVIRSTGIEQIDRAAYRAALSASPYPEPPPDKGRKSRFEVKLVFAPSRL
jgi:protein TonB